MRIVKNILKYSLVLLIGIALFWWIYKDMDRETLKKGLSEVNYFWILASVILSQLSNWSRAVRWKMLIKPLGYHPKVSNIYLSVLVMYFTNLIIPRAGEVARCTILAKYEKIPASKLIGTMIVERIADFMTMMFLAIIIFAINIGIVKEFFSVHPEINEHFVKLLSISNVLLGIAVIVLLVVILLLVNPLKHTGFSEKINKLKTNFKAGIKSIVMLENSWYFAGHTFLIFILWFLMLYSVFLAYPPTSHLSVWTGMFTFLMGGLAMLAPVQGGIGPWHFMVIESLFLYGIDKSDGKIFALIAHSSTNLIYLILGLIALLLLAMVNPKSKHKVHPKPSEHPSVH
jgi:hypothetical protein